ncbi:MAG: MAPEG family protein [Paracoccaceae bacterium]|nr:MAPEG family protein [Paracoccaceae bacterium]
MIDLPVTSLAAIANGLLLLLLTYRVILFRRRGGVVMGDNDDRALAKAIRGQANAAEQIPIALILMGLAEMQGGNALALTVLALLLTLGRLMHGVYFAIHGTPWRLRFYGMLATLAAQAGLLLVLLVTVLT